MNCEDFNKIVDDLAEYRPMSATIRDASVSHAALCPDCAGKLVDARAVGSYLLEAARAESEQAPARLRQNLLTAFADLQRQQAAPVRVVDISSRRTKRSWMAVAAAIAAVILLAIVLSVWRNAPLPGTQPSFQASAPDSPVTTPAIAPQPGSSPVKKSSIVEAPRLSAKVANNNSRKSKRSTPQAGSPSQVSETVAWNAGEFLPLTYLAKGTAMESGTVVRVELSRSALASLGFAAGGEGSAESVKADVILGDDGVARAIRLVQ